MRAKLMGAVAGIAVLQSAEFPPVRPTDWEGLAAVGPTAEARRIEQAAVVSIVGTDGSGDDVSAVAGSWAEEFDDSEAEATS